RDPEAKRAYFRATGAPYRPATGLEAADRLAQPALAGSLELIAREVARALYQGELAAAIIDDIGARGGILSRDDLSTFVAGEMPPLAFGYRGHRGLTLP